MTPFVCLLVEAEGKLSVGFVRDDGRCSAPMEPAAQVGTVVSAIAEQLLGRSCTSDQLLRRRTIVRLSTGQKEGKKTALSIVVLRPPRERPIACLCSPFLPPRPSGGL